MINTKEFKVFLTREELESMKNLFEQLIIKNCFEEERLGEITAPAMKAERRKLLGLYTNFLG